MSVSISRDKDGYKVNYSLPGRGRTCMRGARLGLKSKQQLLVFAGHLDVLIGAMSTATPVPAETQAWLAKISDKLHQRLVTMGVATTRAQHTSLLAYMDSYIHSQTARVTNETVKVWKRARKCAESFFGPNVRLDEVDTEMAVKFRDHLFGRKGKAKGETMSVANVNKMCSVVAQVYSYAVEVGLISKNPFKTNLIKRSVPANPKNHVYVDAGLVRQVISNCRDAEDGLMFALGRFAGLRLPSETEMLRWSDVDLERSVMRIHSPKLKNRPASVRDVPIMPEVEEALRHAQQSATSEYVMPKLRLHKNLGTRAKRTLRKMGIEPWVKPIKNLRASAETDWMNDYGIEEATAWCGNSQRVAIEHYHRIRKASCASEAGLAARAERKTGAPTGAAQPALSVTHSHAAWSRLESAETPQLSGWQEIEATSDDPRELQETGAGGSDLLGSGPYWTTPSAGSPSNHSDPRTEQPKPAPDPSLPQPSLAAVTSALARALMAQPEARAALIESLNALGLQVQPSQSQIAK